MTERPVIVSERVDDIPLVVAQMRRMDLPALLDSHVVTHGNRQGLSLGWTTVVWLAHVLSQADHRLNQVQEWTARRLETLRACTGQPVQELDLSDDRLADVLRTLAADAPWVRFERGLGQSLLRVYDCVSMTGNPRACGWT
jgi:transposase